MRSSIIGFIVVMIVVGCFFVSSDAECCNRIRTCDETKRTFCGDCTEEGRYCGVGSCNIFGCNCDGGCRKPVRTAWCYTQKDCHDINYNAQEMFSLMDADLDGNLSLDEAESYLKDVSNMNDDQIMNASLYQMDSDGDGFLSIEEIDQ